jgi:hypothetical protein
MRQNSSTIWLMFSAEQSIQLVYRQRRHFEVLLWHGLLKRHPKY